MKQLFNFSLNKAVYTAMGAFLLVSFMAGTGIFVAVNRATDDSNTTSILGRQRTLAVEMMKETLAYSAPLAVANMLDQTLDMFRQVYTEDVIPIAQSKGVTISMTPSHTSIPFPATLLRKVMLRLEDTTFPVSSIAEHPVNPTQKLKDEDDRMAWSELKKDTTRPFIIRTEYALKVYTADIATSEACISCHNSYTAKASFIKGDMLGMHRFDLRVSGEDPSMIYQLDKAIFAETIKAAKEGGMVSMKMEKDSPKMYMQKINDPAAQALIGEIDDVFSDFVSTIETLVLLRPGSQSYDEMYNNAATGVNFLLDKSNRLVERYGAVAKEKQNLIKTTLWISFAAVLLTTIIIAWRSIYELASRMQKQNIFVHDMRNIIIPLQNAELHLDTMEPLMKGTDTKHKARSGSDAITKSFQSVLAVRKNLTILIDQSLGLADKTKSTYVMEPYDIVALVRETIEDVKYHKALTGKIFFASVPEKLSAGQDIFINSLDIKRVLQNLIINAGYSIQVQGGEIEVMIEDLLDTVKVSVRDNGHGIPDHIKPLILKKKYTSKSDGNGFGLMSCRDIIQEYHQGKIWFESEVNKGTTFHFQLLKAKTRRKEGRRSRLAFIPLRAKEIIYKRFKSATSLF